LKPTGINGSASTPEVTSSFDKGLENVWHGTGPSNLIVNVLVANAGDFWLMYGLPEVSAAGSKSETTWQGFVSALGFFQGTLETNSGVVKSTNLKEFTSTGLSYGLNIGLKLDGTYVAGSSFDATLTSDNALSGIKTKPAPPTSYIYAVTPKLSDTVADWQGKELITAAPATIAISPQNTFGQKANIKLTVGKCSAVGEIVPRVTSLISENLFDVSLTTSANCDGRSNKKFFGIATSQKVASGKSQLLVMAVSESRDSGLAFWATK